MNPSTAAILVSALWLSACAVVRPVPPAPDPQSAAAVRVAEAAAAHRDYPTWRDFPVVPEPAPTAPEYARRVEALREAEAGLAAEVAAIRWTLFDTPGFLTGARGLIDPELARPVPPGQLERTLEFARAARELATPPPPVK